MGARDLLGKAVEPYVHDKGGPNEATIELKVPKFGDVLPVLKAHQKHTLDMMRQLRGILRDPQPGEEPEAEGPQESVYQMAVPLVKACLVEELTEDEVFELLVVLDVKLELDLNHPLLERCLALAGQRQPDASEVEVTEKEVLDILRGKDPEAVDPISG